MAIQRLLIADSKSLEIRTLAEKSALIEEGRREREWARHLDWIVTHHKANVILQLAPVSHVLPSI